MTRRWTWMVALALLLTGAWACGDPAQEAAEANQAEWQALQAAKDQLDEKRAKLADLRTQLDALPPAGAEPTPEEAAADEGEEGAAASEGEAAPDRQELEERIAALENEIATEGEEFAARLVNYINSLEIVEGEPLTPEQQDAIRMKSAEDIVVAGEWIEKGGDYRRAIEIYEAQLRLDPENETLQAALEDAEAMRFMTEERFVQVEKGMNRKQVRNAIGPVNLRNIQEYPEKKTIAWFYPKEETRSPAAVWFRLDDKSGDYLVYQADFESGGEEAAE